MSPKWVFLQRIALEAIDNAESSIYMLGTSLQDLGWDSNAGPVQELREMLLRLQNIRDQAKRGLDRTPA